MNNSNVENKNKWVLAFFSWIVHYGWFEEIILSFLPPGHTYININ